MHDLTTCVFVFSICSLFLFNLSRRANQTRVAKEVAVRAVSRQNRQRVPAAVEAVEEKGVEENLPTKTAAKNQDRKREKRWMTEPRNSWRKRTPFSWLHLLITEEVCPCRQLPRLARDPHQLRRDPQFQLLPSQPDVASVPRNAGRLFWARCPRYPIQWTF